MDQSIKPRTEPLLADVAKVYGQFITACPVADKTPWSQLTTPQKEQFAATYDDMLMALGVA